MDLKKETLNDGIIYNMRIIIYVFQVPSEEVFGVWFGDDFVPSTRNYLDAWA